MNITEVRVRKIYKEEESTLKAIVSITVDNWLAIHDLKVIEVNGKLLWLCQAEKKKVESFEIPCTQLVRKQETI